MLAKGTVRRLLGAGLVVLPATLALSAGRAVVLADSFTGPVIVNDGTLAGTGTFDGPLTVNAGGTLAPGNSPGDCGIITVNNDVTLNAGSTFAVDVIDLLAGTGYDQLAVSGHVTLAGTLDLTFGSFTPTGQDILFLIDDTGAAPISGTFQYTDNAKVGSFNGYDWFITYDADNGAVPTLNGGNDVAIYSVPEPAALALAVAGTLCLLAHAWRRRKRRSTAAP